MKKQIILIMLLLLTSLIGVSGAVDYTDHEFYIIDQYENISLEFNATNITIYVPPGTPIEPPVDPPVEPSYPDPAITVGWAGSGANYTVDGSNDQVQINQALAYANSLGGGTVELLGPYTYDIYSSNILIGSNTTLYSDSGAVLRLNNNCNWAAMVPVIGQLGGTGPSHDIEIFGLELDCNEVNLIDQEAGIKWGLAYYNAIWISGSSTNWAYNITVHDCDFHDSLGDGVRIYYTTNLLVYNCTFSNMQHSSIYCVEVVGADICDNYIEHITNAGIRLDNSQQIDVYRNELTDYTGSTGGAPKYGSEAIQLGDQPASLGHTRLTSDIDIFDNDIQGALAGVFFQDALGTAGTMAQTVHVHHNLIHDSGTIYYIKYNAGISIWNWGNGIIIEHNQIEDSYGAGILVYNAYTGTVATVYENNIIDTHNTLATNPSYLLGVTGYGILDYDYTAMTINATANYQSGNSVGDYYHVTPNSISATPNNYTYDWGDGGGGGSAPESAYINGTVNYQDSPTFPLGNTYDPEEISTLNATINPVYNETDPYDIPVTGLLGYWKFDEGTGTSIGDSSGNGNNGTATGISWTDGKYNDAGEWVYYETDYVSLPSIDIHNSTDPFTIIANIDRTVTDRPMDIFSDFNIGTGGYVFGWLSSGDNLLSMWWYDGSNQYRCRTTSSVSGEHQVAVTYTGLAGGVIIYIDGEPVTTSITGTSIPTVPHTNTLIGAQYTTYPTTGGRFNGWIDNVILYERALSASEIKGIYYDPIEDLQVKTNSNSTYSSQVDLYGTVDIPFQPGTQV